MVKMLALEDLKNMTEKEIRRHIVDDYSVEKSIVDKYEILVAYESIGSWGCDSSSFFLLKSGGKLYENHGAHCSCYGFEGQFKPEETSVKALKYRLKRGVIFSSGGYDKSPDENRKRINEYIGGLQSD